MKTMIMALLTVSILVLFMHKSNAQNNGTHDATTLVPQTESDLDKSLQQLKSQVLQLNRDLFILEEDLLFPPVRKSHFLCQLI
ncbi:hypothetical protein L3081_15005 [Colwellia sp. MSW7]|uniref:Uncharacterized protein n=1 Tax=Colwellia maritima TaxID=2912588 RepID=A0ABS9X3T3_9GAMM|nr:hypothetical protein [Colwellia maritima]MCI2284457.1 hypothetical protein [Colwellia maritima]